MALSVKITGVQNNQTNLTIDYNIMNDDVIVLKDSMNMEGDSIDFASLKGKILLQMKKLYTVTIKASQIENQLNSVFIPNGDYTDLIKV
jgi:hypothetical protein